LPRCPTASQLLSKAFASKQGDPPQSAPTGEGYAIFQVTGVAAAHAPAFADWKSHVADDYRDEQLPRLLGQKTLELSEKAKSENDLAKAAKAVGATVKTSDLVGLSGQVPDLGQVGQVAPQLFDMAVGQHQRTHQRAAHRRGGQADRQAGAHGGRDREELRPDRDQLLDQRRGEAFNVFMSGVLTTTRSTTASA
jgi:peptidyl-prolyl cis-trans isomerase D